MAAGVTAFALGELYYTLFFSGADDVPFPSPADALYLSFAPCVYVGLVLVLRRRAGALPWTLSLDGIVGGLAVAAAGASVALDSIVSRTSGDVATVATNLAYPLADLLLLGLVAGLLVVTGGRPGRMWTLTGAALALFAVADAIYLYEVAAGRYVESTLLDVCWPAGLALLAFAAWQPVRRLDASALEAGAGAVAMPVAAGMLGIAVMAWDHFHPVSTVALLLTTACLTSVVVRLLLSVRDHTRMLRDSREQAVTDPLTGLGNRRALGLALERALAGERGAEHVLALYDLDGFKRYNDAFGHLAGDALLQRLGRRLTEATGAGAAFRMGGDEFCVLVPHRPASLAAATLALAEHGDSFSVTASHGAVVVPREAATLSDALRLADRRMYAAKRGGGRATTSRQLESALLRALHERDGDLRRHVDWVSSLARTTAAALGLNEAACEEVRQAAALHDIGKVAIPEAILAKPGPLDPGEWACIQRHTIIGERILAEAEDLRGVARIVRSSHERWDGGGYPDGLAGAEIPVGARIVMVCDAYDAMTSDRPYRRARSADEARAELERHAGSQFDPAVVRAFIAAVAPAPLVAAA